MAHPHSVSGREERRVEHISTRRYYVVWIALLVFTAITVVTGKMHLGSGAFPLVLALVIAFVKATLVALFFMHLWDHGGANRLVLVTSLVFFFLLLGITILDNATRFPLTNPPTKENMRWQPPGPDILSPDASTSRSSSKIYGPRDEAPQEQRDPTPGR